MAERAPRATVRLATADDAHRLADLKFEWSPRAEPSTPADRAEFAAHLQRWMRDAESWCVCAIGLVGDASAGMAWLVLYERIPNPDAPTRLCGDIQSVYVRPEHRGGAIGRSLVQTLLDEADRRGVAKLTVDANERAQEFYRHLGFGPASGLLQRVRPAGEH